MFTVTALTKAVIQATDIINTSYFFGMARSFGRTQHSCLSEPRSLSVPGRPCGHVHHTQLLGHGFSGAETLGPSWEGAEGDDLFYERSQRSFLK